MTCLIALTVKWMASASKCRGPRPVRRWITVTERTVWGPVDRCLTYRRRNWNPCLSVATRETIRQRVANLRPLVRHQVEPLGTALQKATSTSCKRVRSCAKSIQVCLVLPFSWYSVFFRVLLYRYSTHCVLGLYVLIQFERNLRNDYYF